MRTLLWCLALALVAPRTARAAPPPSQFAQVISAAGGSLASSSLTLSFTVAQPAAGSFTFANGSLITGFFFPGATVVGVGDAPGPGGSRLISISPNPCVGPVTIEFEVGARDGRSTRLEILDIQGRRVRTLAYGPLAPGPHSIRWGGDGDNGRILPVGVYLARLETTSANSTLRLVHLR